MRVYHRTSREAAGEILRSRSFLSREQGWVFVSNRARGEAEGFGPGLVRLDVPAGLLVLDDEFPGGERHFRVWAEDVRPEWFVLPPVRR